MASSSAPRLAVVGRAGVGVDNVDVPAHSARGVLVINAPTATFLVLTRADLPALLARMDETAEEEADADADVEGCPGCGSMPGGDIPVQVTSPVFYDKEGSRLNG